ncbi:MAG: SMP-30/gluconolactonase/LRE family protein [Chloroflexi bacterium]|nr:SMP-30/gluconolactonase/LRE family protein [Chloroflexota bacterium]
MGDVSPFVIVNDREFDLIIDKTVGVEKTAGGFGFIEGPSWTDRDGGFLVFSDIPKNRMHRWSPTHGLTTFREPTANTNGNTRDHEGNLISCEHSGRRVVQEDGHGGLVTVVDQFGGKKLHSPNDVVVASDGALWFTDPPYGLFGISIFDFPAPPEVEIGRELDRNHVFRFDPKTNTLGSVVDDFDRPNGLCFSPDGTFLYIADSGAPRHIRRFTVNPDNTLSGGGVFCEIGNGVPDGIRCDVDGRLWSSAGDGVHIFGTDGHLIGRIVTPDAPSRLDPAVIAPETVANLCFGGVDGNRLFMTACTSLYSVAVRVRGATQGRTG